jgi:hypothetical protein
VGVADRAEGGVVAGDAERELVQVGLADDRGPGGAQSLDRVLVSVGPGVRQRRRSAAGGEVAGVEVVLHRDRDTGQRSRPALRAVGEGDERAEIGDLPPPRQALRDHLLRGRARDALPDLVEPRRLQGSHATALRRARPRR